jgi:hypothetical protein
LSSTTVDINNLINTSKKNEKKCLEKINSLTIERNRYVQIIRDLEKDNELLRKRIQQEVEINPEVFKNVIESQKRNKTPPPRRSRSSSRSKSLNLD